jgi:hypothetical protein
VDKDNSVIDSSLRFTILSSLESSVTGLVVAPNVMKDVDSLAFTLELANKLLTHEESPNMRSRIGKFAEKGLAVLRFLPVQSAC